VRASQQHSDHNAEQTAYATTSATQGQKALKEVTQIHYFGVNRLHNN
jgi:hypothetical protein